jgi:hypothetical protein
MKNKKKIRGFDNPLEGALTTIEQMSMGYGITKPSPSRKNALTTNVGRHVVDTCCASDTGL